MEKLRSTLTDLAHDFAQQLLGVVRESSVADVRAALGDTRVRTTVRATRGSSNETPEAIVALLEKHRAGMRATEIRDALGMSQARLARLVAEGLHTKKLVKTGVRRGTMYFAR
ncbi:MAG: hypothetical protein ABIP89_06785 [Polyangiaceae bacterium]